MKLGQYKATNRKSKKFHVRKNSQPLPKMTFRNGGLGGMAQLKTVEMEKIGIDGLSLNKMKEKLSKKIFAKPKLPGPWPKTA